MIGLLKREMALVLMHPGEVFYIFLFVLLCGILFPLGIGFNQEVLWRYGPGCLWIISILALNLTLSAYYDKDKSDGSLEILCLYDPSAYGMFLVKSLNFLIFHGISLGGAVFLLGMLFGFPLWLALGVTGSLLLTLPGLIWVTNLGAVCMIEAPLSLFVRPLIVFPFYIPLFIFGTQILENLALHQPVLPCIQILGALSLLTLCFSTFIGGKILQISLDG